MTDEYFAVFVTAPAIEIGKQIAQKLVSEKLAACVNILPGITSIYTWQGEICDDAEVQLIIKTRAACFDALTTTIQTMHPYEVPEIIALPIVAGSNRYLDWIKSVTQV